MKPSERPRACGQCAKPGALLFQRGFSYELVRCDQCAEQTATKLQLSLPAPEVHHG